MGTNTGGKTMDKLGLGRKMEALCMKRWEWQGFKTWQPPRAKYTSQDIFELFDFVAIRGLCPLNLVQVKRHRRKEAETAMDAIKAFQDEYNAPVSCFLVLWRKERRTARIVFEAWQYGLAGWFAAGEWTDGR